MPFTSARASVDNIDKMPEGQGCLIAASYDDNGVLQKIKMYNLSEYNNDAQLYLDFDAGEKLTLLLWDSIGSMVPYDKAEMTIKHLAAQ